MCKSKMMVEIRIAIIAGGILGMFFGWCRYPLPLAEVGEIMFPPVTELQESFVAVTVAVFFGIVATGLLFFLSKEKVVTQKLWRNAFHITAGSTFLITLTIFHVLGENLFRYGMVSRAFQSVNLYVAIWPVPILPPLLRLIMIKCQDS